MLPLGVDHGTDPTRVGAVLTVDTPAPHMANQGCARIVAQTFGVSTRNMPLPKSRGLHA